MNAKEELLGTLRSSGVLIGYSPVGDEPDVASFLIQNGISKRGLSVLPSKDTDPIETASSLTAHNNGKQVCIFVPGRAFDRTGTRHGRGGGWYDRLLANIPPEWVRIGVAAPAHVHDETLIRKEWDEPVQYILVKNNEWSVIMTKVA